MASVCLGAVMFTGVYMRRVTCLPGYTLRYRRLCKRAEHTDEIDPLLLRAIDQGVEIGLWVANTAKGLDQAKHRQGAAMSAKLPFSRLNARGRQADRRCQD